MSTDLDAIEARLTAHIYFEGNHEGLDQFTFWTNEAGAALFTHAQEDLAALMAEVRTLRRVNEARQRNNEKLSAKAAGLLAENERLRAVADALVSARGNRCSGSGVGLYEVAPHALAALDVWRGGEGK